ncbi:MAG: penicillin acylase family protein [Pseudoxanthomonas sp.]
MLKWIRRALLALLVVIVACFATGWWLLHGSLARLDGHAALAGLSAPVTLARDKRGTASIDAADDADAARALGYVHAQERYFEMDLLRRSPAGELAALFGPPALAHDRAVRLHRMRAQAEATLAALDPAQRALLDAYAAGVNAGLAALRVRPWPYLLLRQRPQPWTPADSLLAGYAMYFDLQDADGVRERGLAQLHARLPAPLYALLVHAGSSWDAPLTGDALGDAALPGPDQVDLRQLPSPAGDDGNATEAHAPGSNNFAVGGALTADGRAIVADDMHLGLRVPNLWFRARLRFADPQAAGGRVDVTGFTLPGLPAVIVGSNGHVAWGFTNSYADTTDLFRVHPCKAPGETGCEPVQVQREVLHVAGAADQTLDVRQTRYGPLVEDRADGSALALRWVGQLPGALNLGLAEFARAGDLSQLLSAAAHTAIPAQNLVAADAAGHIAWRVLGPLPQRAPGCGDPAQVLDAGPACPPWPISTALAEPIVDPADARLWTANARTSDGARLALLGDGGYALGARAQQIRDDLRRRDRFNERSLLAIQLDDRAVLLQRWWSLLQVEAGSARTGSALAALARAAGHWDGNAEPSSVSYRLVRAWRLAVVGRIAEGLAAPARVALGPGFELPTLSQFEGVAWPLLQQRPAHLLPRRWHCADATAASCPDGWHALLEDAAAEVRTRLTAQGPLAQRSWGEANTAAICHPLARALPQALKPLLCMPAEALAGDTAMPRVAGPDFGASERMVVSPGHEADGIAHMPGGQSGHPLSPFWGAGHEDWVHGRPTPFLPGKAKHSLVLEAGKSG